MTPAPFIVGVSRSGTTLLRLMLDAHPALAIPPETHFLQVLLERPPAQADAFLSVVTGAQTWPDFHLDAEALRQRIVARGPFGLAGAVEAFYEAYAERRGKPRWGDKTPPYVLRIAAIRRLLPQARFIHIVRDVRDVALSLRDKWFGPGADVERAATFWRDRIETARRQAAEFPAETYTEIRYEDLVADPERVLRKVCAAIALAFDPAMLDYHREARERLDEMQDWRNAGGDIVVPRERWLEIHRHTLKPPDPEQIGKWRGHYTPEQAARFRAVAGTLMDELGYLD